MAPKPGSIYIAVDTENHNYGKSKYANLLIYNRDIEYFV